MTSRRFGAALCAAALLFNAGAARAQLVVHDPAAYAQMIREARTALDQLRALQRQVEQGAALLESLNDPSDVNDLAQVLGLPQVRDPLPDLQALRRAADGDLSALGDLADRAEAIRAETRLYSPDAEAISEAERHYHEALERAGARTARDLALGEAVNDAADQRLSGLESLRQALDTAPDARAVLDLETRLTAEQALIQNEQVRLQGLALTQAAEARLEAQRARERAAAARDRRLTLYGDVIQ